MDNMERTNWKTLIEELRIQWKQMWHERIDDKLRAEGIAYADFASLFVDEGTVIFATRDFKMPSFREIVERHGVPNVDNLLPPDPHVGGWRKFIRTMSADQKLSCKTKRANRYSPPKKQAQHPKKGGRGWLHL